MAAAGKEEKTGTDKERDKEIEAQLERGEGDGQGNIEEWPIGAQTAAPTSTATPTAAATAVQTPAAAEFPVLHALAAKHSEYKWISIHEGSHSHYHFAQPALELVPNKLACVEWLLVKQRAVPNNKIRALGSDVQLCGANSKDGHWLLVCDIYVLHFKSRGALRVELLVYDAADGRCFTEQITNVTSIVDRTSTPPLTPSALTLIENSEDLVEHEVKDKEAEKAHDDKRVAAADTRSNIDLSAAVSPVGSSSHRLSPRAHARASYKESELQGEAATMGIGSDSGGERKVPRRGLTKAGVSKMISAAIKGTQDRLTRALKRDHDELLAAIGAAKHEQPPAKRPKVVRLRCCTLFCAVVLLCCRCRAARRFWLKRACAGPNRWTAASAAEYSSCTSAPAACRAADACQRRPGAVAARRGHGAAEVTHRSRAFARGGGRIAAAPAVDRRRALACPVQLPFWLRRRAAHCRERTRPLTMTDDVNSCFIEKKSDVIVRYVPVSHFL